MSLENLSGLLYFVAIMAVLELFPIDLAIVSWKSTHRKVVNDKVKIRPIPSNMKIFYYMPIACVAMAYKSFFKKTGWTKPVGIIAAVFILIRVFMFLPFMDSLSADIVFFRLVYAYSIPMFLIGIALFHILHVAAYFRIMRLFRFGTLAYILVFIAPYGVAALLKSSIPQQLFMDKESLTSRFDENYKPRVKKKKSSSSTTVKSKTKTKTRTKAKVHE